MVKKIKFYKNFKVSNAHQNSILLIGNFDGLHAGHQKLFNLAKKYKKNFKLKIGVITFEPMPKMYFNKKLKNFRISNISQKNKILKKMGTDFLITKKFDNQFYPTLTNSKKNLEEKSIKEILKADENSSKSSSQGSTTEQSIINQIRK